MSGQSFSFLRTTALILSFSRAATSQLFAAVRDDLNQDPQGRSESVIARNSRIAGATTSMPTASSPPKKAAAIGMTTGALGFQNWLTFALGGVLMLGGLYESRRTVSTVALRRRDEEVKRQE